MNRMPPEQDPPEDVDERYRRASALDSSHPSEATRAAVLAHAAELASGRAAGTAQEARAQQPAARAARGLPGWRAATYAGLAVAALAALMIVPRALRTPSPPAGTAVRVNGLPPPPVPGAAPSGQPSPAPEPPPGSSAPSEARTAMAGREHGRSESGNRAPPAGFAAVPSPRALTAGAAAQSPAARAAAATADRSEAADVSALHAAAAAGDVVALQSVLARQPQIDARDLRGRTALMLAVRQGQAAAVETLLSHGADPNLPDAQGVTPLQLAQAAGQSEIVLLLRRFGAR